MSGPVYPLRDVPNCDGGSLVRVVHKGIWCTGLAYGAHVEALEQNGRGLLAARASILRPIEC